jgi:uncharacterized protein (TIGR03118 family)
MSRAHRRPSPLSARPGVESLEGRCLLANNVLQTNLVSDLAGVAQAQDPQLKNPWGISEGPGGPFWISDNNAGVSTLYNTAGVKQGLVVDIPAPGDLTGFTGTPTGTVFNDSAGGFKLSGVDKTGAPATPAPAVFLFATEDGTIVGWNPGINPAGIDLKTAGKHGIIAVDNSAIPTAADGAVYKGLTLATSQNGPIVPGTSNTQSLLYAANFRSGKIDVFGTDFAPVNLGKGAFTDPNLPKGYAPFNVQQLGGKIYVTYALQDDARHDDVAGPGHGFVDVYNLDGSGGQRLVSRGPLDSPWGLAIAPSSFGPLAGALLVGNFGDGHINAFNVSNPSNVTSLGQLKDPDGEPIQINGLWALKVGNGNGGGDSQTLYFTAGLDHENHGLFGSLSPVAAGTPEGPAEQQAVTAAVDVFQLSLTAVQKDLTSGVKGATLNADIRTLDQALVDLVRAERQFANDAAADGGLHGAESAASQALDGVFAQLGNLPGLGDGGAG